MSEILTGLTEAQRSAVTHIKGPLLVVAGPGSGKTRVITHRIAYMLEESIPDFQILALTFTNKAAGEMNERLEDMVGVQDCFISTFHSMSARLLRRYAEFIGYTKGFTIYDTADSKNMIKEVIKMLNVDTSYFKPNQVKQSISNYKNSMISPREVASRTTSFWEENLAKIYRRYQEELKARNSMDFDDLLLNMLEVMKNEEILESLQDRFQYILVDEYQDTNHVQYKIVKQLGKKHRNICATGDPDQSIYGWRGADIRNILDFEKDFPDAKVVKLEQNYRSTKTILRVADAVIRNNTQRKDKELFTENPEGPPLKIKQARTEKDESRIIARQVERWIRRGVPPREIAIFYRVNSLSRNIEEYFRYNNIPYTIVGGVEFYQRMEIKDILAYARLMVNPYDSASFLRIVNTPRRGIGKSTLESLTEYIQKEDLSYLEAVENPEKIDTLSTRAQNAVAKFAKIIEKLKSHSQTPVAPFLEIIIEEIEYRKYMEKSYSGEEQMNRLSNLDELLTAADEFDHSEEEEKTLLRFLEQVTLFSDIDQWDQEEKVTLMTLHASKGLEFEGVVIAGLEDGILPHNLSKEELGGKGIEEERRLFYVGITRAKERLLLTHTRRRNLWGRSEMRLPSPFFDEVERGLSEDEAEEFTPF